MFLLNLFSLAIKRLKYLVPSFSRAHPSIHNQWLYLYNNVFLMHIEYNNKSSNNS